MTTLELAEAIARAVHETDMYTVNNGVKLDAPAKAVLETLRQHDSWFCRVSDREDGVTVDTPYEQVELFK